MSTRSAQRPAVRDLLQQGLGLQREGDYVAAAAAYGQVLAVQPLHFDALHMLGVLELQTGRADRALDWLARAVAQREEASALANLATTLRLLGRTGEAAAALARVAAARPDSADAQLQYASALSDLGRHEEALAACDRAARLAPTSARAHVLRAAALRALERPEDALASATLATEVEPTLADAWDRRGAAARDLLRLEEAAACFATAIARRPDHALAHLNAGMTDLLQGRFARGWTEFEWRLRAGGPVADPYPARPRWRGEPLRPGQVLLVWAEQGLGDTIQFCRYLPLAAARGATVVVCAPRRLHALLATLAAPLGLCAPGDEPSFDWHCPLMSLPLALGLDEEALGGSVPYLKAEPARVARWRASLGETGYRIGVCWQGSRLPIDIGRSFPLRSLAPVARVAGVRLISLQCGEGSEQLSDLPAGFVVERPGPDFDAGADAFVDTAAVMSCLDLVISTDTSVAHLAGALGTPTWLALKHAPEWRWMLGRADSPWYPGHRLFRQPARGDWNAVFEAMRAALDAGDCPGHRRPGA